MRRLTWLRLLRPPISHRVRPKIPPVRSERSVVSVRTAPAGERMAASAARAELSAPISLLSSRTDLLVCRCRSRSLNIYSRSGECIRQATPLSLDDARRLSSGIGLYPSRLHLLIVGRPHVGEAIQKI